MPWAKLDDGYETHPKTELEDLVAGTAVALHAKAIAYCARHLTDGRIPASWVRGQLHQLRPKQRRDVLARAVAARLLEPDGDDFRVHDYLDHNRSRAEVEKDRQTAAKRQADFREKQRQGTLPWEPEAASA